KVVGAVPSFGHGSFASDHRLGEPAVDGIAAGQERALAAARSLRRRSDARVGLDIGVAVAVSDPLVERSVVMIRGPAERSGSAISLRGAPCEPGLHVVVADRHLWVAGASDRDQRQRGAPTGSLNAAAPRAAPCEPAPHTVLADSARGSSTPAPRPWRRGAPARPRCAARGPPRRAVLDGRRRAHRAARRRAADPGPAATPWRLRGPAARPKSGRAGAAPSASVGLLGGRALLPGSRPRCWSPWGHALAGVAPWLRARAG